MTARAAPTKPGPNAGPRSRRYMEFREAVYQAIKRNRDVNPDTGANVCAGLLDAKETALFDDVARIAGEIIWKRGTA